MSLCSSLVIVCENHNIEMPILGVKEAMSAMSNPSLLSTFLLEKPSLTHEYESISSRMNPLSQYNMYHCIEH